MALHPLADNGFERLLPAQRGSLNVNLRPAFG